MATHQGELIFKVTKTAKRCTACRMMKDPDDYNTDKSASDQLTSQCAACGKHRRRLWGMNDKGRKENPKISQTSIDDLAQRYVTDYQMAVDDMMTEESIIARGFELNKTEVWIRAKILADQGTALLPQLIDFSVTSRIEKRIPAICDYDLIADRVYAKMSSIVRAAFGDKPEVPIKGSKEPQRLLTNYFEHRDHLKAQFIELGLLTPYSRASWTNAKKALVRQGYKFKKKNGYHLISKPEQKSDRHKALEAVADREIPMDEFEAFDRFYGVTDGTS